MTFVIEFRNGSYFQSLDDDHGGPIETAMKFKDIHTANLFMDNNEWIYFNGGMAVKAPTPHDWTLKSWTGYLADEWYECSRCSAHNNALTKEQIHTFYSFLACGCGHDNVLPSDCDEAHDMVIRHRRYYCTQTKCGTCDQLRGLHGRRRWKNTGACEQFTWP